VVAVLATPPEKDNKDTAFRWRREDAYITVTGPVFAKLVHENGLEVKGPFGGYLYAMKHTTEGEELYRTLSDGWDDVPLSTANGANPAAGADPAAITVPAGKRWLLLGVRDQMVTDANVADRFPTLTVTNGATAFFATVDSNAQTAGLTHQHYFALGAGAAVLSGTTHIINIPIGGIELGPGYVFQVTYANIQAGDDATAITYVYKERDA